jgi:hypothetical protein
VRRALRAIFTADLRARRGPALAEERVRIAQGRVSMVRHASLWLVVCAHAIGLAALAPASLVSAQTGVIIQPSYTTAPPQQQQYVVQAPAYTQPYGAGIQCPPDATLQPDRRGVARCMRLESGHRVIWGLTGAGIGLLAGGYLLEILSTAFSSLDSSFGRRDTYVGWGYVPLVGPWVQMGDLPPSTSSPMYVLLTFEGLLQAAGLVMVIVGAVGEDYEEYRPIAAGDFRVSPVLSQTMQGLTIEGAF